MADLDLTPVDNATAIKQVAPMVGKQLDLKPVKLDLKPVAAPAGKLDLKPVAAPANQDNKQAGLEDRFKGIARRRLGEASDTMNSGDVDIGKAISNKEGPFSWDNIKGVGKEIGGAFDTVATPFTSAAEATVARPVAKALGTTPEKVTDVGQDVIGAAQAGKGIYDLGKGAVNLVKGLRGGTEAVADAAKPAVEAVGIPANSDIKPAGLSASAPSQPANIIDEIKKDTPLVPVDPDPRSAQKATADGLARLQLSNQATTAKNMDIIEALDKQYSKEIQESTSRKLQAGEPLNDQEQALADTLEKHAKDNVELYNYVYGTNIKYDPKFMHRQELTSRVPAGVSLEERGAGGFSPGSKSLSKTTSGSLGRKYYSIDTKDGPQVVFADEDGLLHSSEGHTGYEAVKKGKPRPGAIYEDAEGNRVELKNASEEQIQGSTNKIYAGNAVRSVMGNNTELRIAAQRARFLNTLMPNLEKAGLASRKGTRGFQLTKVPQLKKWHVAPDIAATFDRFFKQGETTGLIGRAYEGINHVANQSLFVIPVKHSLNVFASSIVNRGWKNLNPLANARYLGHLAGGFKDALTFSKEYTDAMMNGLRLNDISNRTQKYNNLLLGSYIKALSKNQNKLAAAAKSLGMAPVELIKIITQGGHRITWKVSDAVTMARYRELLSEGKSGEEAAKIIHRTVAPYDPIVSIMGSDRLGRVLSDQMLFRFSRYDVHQISALGNMIRQGLNPASKDFKQASGELFTTAVLAALGSVGIEAMDKITGGRDTMAGRVAAMAGLRGVPGVPGFATRLVKGGANAMAGNYPRAMDAFPLNFQPIPAVSENLVFGQAYPGGPKLRSDGDVAAMMLNQFGPIPQFLSGK